MEHWTSYITNNKCDPTKIPNFDENSEINKKYIKTKKHMKDKGFDLLHLSQCFMSPSLVFLNVSNVLYCERFNLLFFEKTSLNFLSKKFTGFSFVLNLFNLMKL